MDMKNEKILDCMDCLCLEKLLTLDEEIESIDFDKYDFSMLSDDDDEIIGFLD